MRKGIYVAIVVIVALALVGCGIRTAKTAKASADEENAAPPQAANAPQEVVAPQPAEPTESRITKTEAQTAALTHANVERAQARDLETELEYTRGVLYYEVSFEAGGYEYEYLIDITTGQVAYVEKEVDR